MYYRVCGLIYLLSLLPFWLLYGISDIVSFTLFYLVGYRKKVVMQNLKNAFPEKTPKELKIIGRRFYRNFCDTWIEMLKILSISKKEVARRVTFNYDVINELHKTGIPVQAFAGHFMNWEFANISVALNQPYPFLGIYMPINSALLNRLICHLRSRFGTILLKAGNVKKDMEGWDGKPYIIGIAADQSPSNPHEVFWLNFMSQRSGFIKKPWQKVKALNHAVVYMKMLRVKRGFYHFDVSLVSDDVSLISAEHLVLKYRDLLEADINNSPDNYLWTHRRWKNEWREEYRDLWIDKRG
jgi:KDO2-lipid IV(A) lauroyltransferase